MPRFIEERYGLLEHQIGQRTYWIIWHRPDKLSRKNSSVIRTDDGKIMYFKSPMRAILWAKRVFGVEVLFDSF